MLRVLQIDSAPTIFEPIHSNASAVSDDHARSYRPYTANMEISLRSPVTTVDPIQRSEDAEKQANKANIRTNFLQEDVKGTSEKIKNETREIVSWPSYSAEEAEKPTLRRREKLLRRCRGATSGRGESYPEAVEKSYSIYGETKLYLMIGESHTEETEKITLMSGVN